MTALKERRIFPVLNPKPLLKGFFTSLDISPALVSRILYRHWLVFAKTWKANIMFNFVEPVLYLWAMGFGLGVYVANIQGYSYLEFIAPGLIASSAMFATCYEATYDSYTRMSFHKIFYAIVSTPASMDDVVMAELIYGALKSVLYGSVFLLVTVLFGLVKSWWVFLMPIPLFIGGLIFSSLSMVWTSMAPNYDAFNYFFTLIITPMFFLAGIFFPVNNLPAGVQAFSWLTPLYHEVEVIRNLFYGQINMATLANFVWLTAAMLLLIRFPLVMVRNRLIQ